MLALCLMLSGTYYAKNYAGIIGRGLTEGAVIATEAENRKAKCSQGLTTLTTKSS